MRKITIVTRFVKRDTISQAVSMAFSGGKSWHYLWQSWHDFWIRFVYLGLYVTNRDTIFPILTQFLQLQGTI